MIPLRIPFATLVAAVAGMVFSLAASVSPAAAAGEPTNVRGVALGQTALRVSWDDAGAQFYQVRYGTRSDLVGGTVLPPATGTTRQISGLRAGTRYYFTVRVTDSAGTALSGWSAIAYASTKPLMKIAVASYNIKDPDSSSLGSWSVRGPRSAAAIVGQGVKLLGVQEVFEEKDRVSMLRFINDKVAGSDPYSMVPAVQLEAGQDSRIIFDTRALRHIASGGFSFATQNGSEDRALAWGKFQHRASGRYIFFVTTHLSPRSDSVDVAQWKQLISWANKVRSANPTYKFIITGDFNTTKFEPPATMLAAMRSNGYEDVLGQIRNSYSTYRNPSVRVDAWISSSNRSKKDLRDCGCLVSTDRNSNSIDYVFVSKALKATYYRVYAQPRHGLVMDYLMSDHFMVRATISQ